MLLFFLFLFNILNNSFAINFNSIIWNKNDQNFVPLFNTSIFFKMKNNHVKKIKDLEFHNFQKEIVIITYYQENNFVNFIDNDTKITGVFGEIWTDLADYLNLTLVPLKVKERKLDTELKNGSFDEIMGLIERNQSQVIARIGTCIARLQLLDYTLPLWKIRYHIYIKPEWKYNPVWMFDLFSRRLWYSFLILLLILSIAGYIEDKYTINSLKEKNYFNLQDHIFYTVAIASSQVSISSNFYKKSRIYLCTTVFSWLMLIAFSSHAIYHMMNKKFDLPFTDLKSLFEKSKYQILAFRGSMVHVDLKNKVTTYFKSSGDAARISYTSSTSELYQKVCFSNIKTLAVFDAEDRYKSSGKFVCNLVPAKTSYFDTWIVSGIKRGYKYKRSFDIGILKLTEIGLINGIKNRWFNWKSNEIEDIPFQSIDISQVYFIYNILILGFITSTLILIIEYVTHSKFKQLK